MNLQKIVGIVSSFLAVFLLVLFCYFGAKILIDNKKQKENLNSLISRGYIFVNLQKLPNFNNSNQTLLIALSTSCQFCDESVPFYRRLAENNFRSGKKVNLVAVFKEDKIFVENFTLKKKLQMETVSNLDFNEIDVSGTPTLILIDNEKKVLAVWKGKLDSSQEDEILNEVNLSIN